MKFSKDLYEISTNLPLDEIVQRLDSITLKSNTLVMKHTSKDFIGQIYSRHFSIIEASFFPYGAACIIKGELDNNKITLRTNLHAAFEWLIAGWFIILAGVIIFLPNKELSLIETLIQLFILFIGAVIFRLFLHGLYVLARNSAVTKLKALFESQSISLTD